MAVTLTITIPTNCVADFRDAFLAANPKPAVIPPDTQPTDLEWFRTVLDQWFKDQYRTGRKRIAQLAATIDQDLLDDIDIGAS